MSASNEGGPPGRDADPSGCLARIASHLDVPVSTFFRPESRIRLGDRFSPWPDEVSELVRLFACLGPEGRTAVLALAHRLGAA